MRSPAVRYAAGLYRIVKQHAGRQPGVSIRCRARLRPRRAHHGRQ
jgi:hypothetical protein